MIAFAAAALLVAAAGKPDWIERESGHWPRELYLTGVGSADDRGAAEDRARAELARIFTTRVVSTYTSHESESRGGGSEQTVADDTTTTADKVLEGVEIAQVWVDAETHRTYALAVLDRKQAAARLDQRLSELEQRAKPLRAELESPEKSAALSAALRLLRVERDRRAVEKDLEIVVPSRRGQASPPESGARALLAHTAVGVSVTGDEGGSVHGAVATALQAAGLSVASGPSSDLVSEATVQQEELGVREGWHWSRATVDVVVRDAGTSRVVFTVHETAREGSRMEGESARRALKKVADKLRASVPLALQASVADH